MNVDEMVEQIAKDCEPMTEEEFSEIRRKIPMKSIIITCKTNDWLDYRTKHKGSLETDVNTIKVYDGVLNIEWKCLTCFKALEEYFKSKNSIITYNSYCGNVTKDVHNDYSLLERYAPIIKGGRLVYTEKEVC